MQDDKYTFKDIYIDTTMSRNIQGYEIIGRNYQDKFKNGTKVSAICDRKGIPISLTFETIDTSLSFIVIPIIRNRRFTNNLIADKGYRSKDKKLELKQTCQVNLIANQRSNEKNKMFGRLKQFKRPMLRYDGLISTFKSFFFWHRLMSPFQQ